MVIKGKNVKATVNYEILEVHAERELENGSVLRVAEVSWNGRAPKFDIRKWTKQDDGTEKCGKGLTLDETEINLLAEMFKELDDADSDDE